MIQNFIYDELLRVIPGLSMGRVSSGWMTFNCVACQHNGEPRPDTRRRAGLKLTSENAVVYHCFNCKFATSWKPGQALPKKMKNLLSWCSCDQDTIRKLSFKAWQNISHSTEEVKEKPIQSLSFDKQDLPKGAKSFTRLFEEHEENIHFVKSFEYMMGRGDVLCDWDNVYWTPLRDQEILDINKRIIIPFYWGDKIVGYTARSTIGSRNRYINKMPNDYLFNTQIIQPQHQYIIVSEGPFDALSINGVATLGDHVTERQLKWLLNTGKEIICLPDREKQGGTLVDVALRNNWYVSFPLWERDIKDAADAVKNMDDCIHSGQLLTVRQTIV